MRHNNGFGGVSHLGGNRRRPYRARVTLGWDNGKQIYKTVGYFSNQQEAYEALLAYHKDPNQYDNKTLTLKEAFDKWSSLKFETATKASINGYNSAYKYMRHLDDKLFIHIKADHIRDCIKKCDKSKSTKNKIKILFTQLFNWAIENDIVEKNYAKFVKVEASEEDDEKIPRIPFTNDEIKLLWNNVDEFGVDTILIMLYSGIRIKELEILTLDNINLEERWFKTGVKTSAGKGRLIPIHDKIYPLFEKRCNTQTEYFVTLDDKQITYKKYRTQIWDTIMEKLNMEHLPHDTRHTFVSEMHRKGVNELNIKRIVGHSNRDVTDHYTHTVIHNLLLHINTIDYM